MGYSVHDAYLESRVLSAGPIELVRILYQTAANAVRDARRFLEQGEILARSRAISRASEALLQLTGALDVARGGEIAARLAHLYAYMLRRLTEANFQQVDAPLAEVLALLATLFEGWEGVRNDTPAPAQVNPQWTPSIAQPESATSAHAWSF
jgi:flagellar protein FliS